MLILTRKRNEEIKIGEDVTVKVLSIEGGYVRLGFDAPSRTLYVCMRAVAPSPGTFTNRPQWDRIFALADSVTPARFVIDLRENTGGNGTLNRYPVQQLLHRPLREPVLPARCPDGREQSAARPLPDRPRAYAEQLGDLRAAE